MILREICGEIRYVRYYKKDKAAICLLIHLDRCHILHFFSENADGLCCQLTQSCPKREPTLTDLSKETRDKWEISRDLLEFHDELGHGQFGEVWQGKQISAKECGFCFVCLTGVEGSEGQHIPSPTGSVIKRNYDVWIVTEHVIPL